MWRGESLHWHMNVLGLRRRAGSLSSSVILREGLSGELIGLGVRDAILAGILDEDPVDDGRYVLDLTL